ncbi:MAG: hypothetical protein II913_02660 [Elusimicrobiaceae bacterium]|nr:hypothetical protein [Elusimicrobiaceae bacterium]
MNFSRKIELENNIFAQAAKLHAQVHTRGGRFFSSSKDRYLQALLDVYNAFFYKENRDNFCVEEEYLEGLYYVNRQAVRTPLFSAKDYKFELIVGGKNA